MRRGLSGTAVLVTVIASICIGAALLPAGAEARRVRTDRAHGTCTYVTAQSGRTEELTFSIRPATGGLPASGYILHGDPAGSWAAAVSAAAVEGRDAYFGGAMLWWMLDVPPGSDAPQPVETNVYVAVHDGGLPGGAGDTVFVTIGDLVDPAALVAARYMPPLSTVGIASGDLVVIDR